jgi:hypothetical protein
MHSGQSKVIQATFYRQFTDSKSIEQHSATYRQSIAATLKEADARKPLQVSRLSQFNSHFFYLKNCRRSRQSAPLFASPYFFTVLNHQILLHPKIMPTSQSFTQSIAIRTNSTTVERCFTDIALMNSWLNPILRCEALPDTAWSTKLGAKSQFAIQIPILRPVLISTIVEREPGLIVWEFDGFFQGRDLWEVQPQDQGSLLVNRFEFTIPNPIVAFGFNTFAAKWTKADMEAQLQRLKQVAERL